MENITKLVHFDNSLNIYISMHTLEVAHVGKPVGFKRFYTSKELLKKTDGISINMIIDIQVA